MGSLACPLCCDNVFSSRSSLKHHLLEVENKIQCPDCSEKFRSILALANHLDGQCLKPTEIVEIKSEVLETKEFSEVYVDGQTEKKDDSNSHLQDVASSISSLNEESTSQMAIDPLHDLAVIKSEIDDSDSEDRLSFKTEMDIDIDRDNEFKLDEPSSHQHSRGDKGDWLERELEKLDSINDAETVTLDDAAAETQNPYFCSDCGVTFPDAEEHIRKSHSERPTPATEEMGGTHKRKTNRGNWTTEDLQSAVRAIRNGRSIRSVSKSTGISFSTLQGRISKKQYSAPTLGKKSAFTPDQETELCTQLIKLADIFYGLSSNYVRRAAYEFAEINNIEHPFSKEAKMAGRYWLDGFLKRNPSLPVRKPEGLCIELGFDKEEITRFYRTLENMFLKYHFPARNIYNVDETEFETVLEPEIISDPKEKKRVSGGGQSKQTTVICAMSAAGNYIPPMFIFARTQVNPSLEKVGPSRALYTCSKNGQTNETLFLKWLQHLVSFSCPTPETPILLILDSHFSHCTLTAYAFCKMNSIVMMSVPPHTFHKTQPLEVSFLGPLKIAFSMESLTYLNLNKLKYLRLEDFAALFEKAYGGVATVGNAVSAFKATGIFPFNASVFSDLECYNANPPSIYSAANTGTKDKLADGLKQKSESSPGSSTHDNRSRSRQHSDILTATPMETTFEAKKLRTALLKGKTRSKANPKKSPAKSNVATKPYKSLSEEEDKDIVCDDKNDDDIWID